MRTVKTRVFVLDLRVSYLSAGSISLLASSRSDQCLVPWALGFPVLPTGESTTPQAVNPSLTDPTVGLTAVLTAERTHQLSINPVTHDK